MCLIRNLRRIPLNYRYFSTIQPEELANVLNTNRKGYIPRRALLYLPGSSQKMLDKAPDIEVNLVFLTRNILVESIT